MSEAKNAQNVLQSRRRQVCQPFLSMEQPVEKALSKYVSRATALVPKYTKIRFSRNNSNQILPLSNKIHLIFIHGYLLFINIMCFTSKNTSKSTQQALKQCIFEFLTSSAPVELTIWALLHLKPHQHEQQPY